MTKFAYLAVLIGISSACTSFVACSKNQIADHAADSRAEEWSTICLGPLILDIPDPIDMGATEDRFRAFYDLDGINDIPGGKEIRFDQLTIYETVETNGKRFSEIQLGAARSVASLEVFRARWPVIESEIHRFEKRALSGTPEERAFARELAQDAINNLRESKYGAKVSGQATLNDANAFAFRRGDQFSVGYLDADDKRARVFDGVITDLEVESPRAAALKLEQMRTIYHRRAVNYIPTVPGFCTVFGMIQETIQPRTVYTLEVPFRSLKYPNLLFTLTVESTQKTQVRNIQELPKLGEDQSNFHLVGIKGKYGPKRVTMLGAPGRSIGYKFGDNCSPDSCRPADQAYEIEAETYGELGQPDKPHIVLHMIAATSDEYKLKLPKEPRYADYAVPQRPILAGHVPPPFEEGIKIFETVLRSIRLRPGAIAQHSAPSTTSPER